MRMLSLQSATTRFYESFTEGTFQSVTLKQT